MEIGNYAYRFRGYSVTEGISSSLVGVGVMTLGANKLITGHQRTALTRLSGQDSELTIGYWSMTGRYSLVKNGYSAHDQEAVITFTQLNVDTTPENQILEGTFNFVPVSKKKIWLIGTGGTLLSSSGTAVNEVVSGEAELIE